MERPDRYAVFLEYASRVRSRSLAMGIPSVDPEDGFALYTAVALVAAGRSGIHVVDAGAGIGYSTLWLGQALEEYCAGPCRLTAVEVDRQRASRAREVLAGAAWSRVEWSVVNADALDYLESLNDGSLDVAFIDIDKWSYTRALRILEAKLKPGGVALFHNAFFPLPPGFHQAARTGPWVGGVIPTPEGLYMLVRRP